MPPRPRVLLAGTAMPLERVGRDAPGMVGDFTSKMAYNCDCELVVVGLDDACKLD